MGNELQIVNVSLNLAGVYVCHAESPAGIVEKVFHVEVLGKYLLTSFFWFFFISFACIIYGCLSVG